jgi:hypothetical protein
MIGEKCAAIDAMIGEKCVAMISSQCTLASVRKFVNAIVMGTV